MQGTTDYFFVLTVYFGSVGIKKYGYAIITGLTADITGFIASIYICNLLLDNKPKPLKIMAGHYLNRLLTGQLQIMIGSD